MCTLSHFLVPFVTIRNVTKETCDEVDISHDKKSSINVIQDMHMKLHVLNRNKLIYYI